MADRKAVELFKDAAAWVTDLVTAPVTSMRDHYARNRLWGDSAFTSAFHTGAVGLLMGSLGGAPAVVTTVCGGGPVAGIIATYGTMMVNAALWDVNGAVFRRTEARKKQSASLAPSA